MGQSMDIVRIFVINDEECVFGVVTNVDYNL